VGPGSASVALGYTPEAQAAFHHLRYAPKHDHPFGRVKIEQPFMRHTITTRTKGLPRYETAPLNWQATYDPRSWMDRGRCTCNAYGKMYMLEAPVLMPWGINGTVHNSILLVAVFRAFKTGIVFNTGADATPPDTV